MSNSRVMPDTESGQHRKSFRLRQAARDRLLKLTAKLDATQRAAIIMAVEKAHAKRPAAKKGSERRHTACQYLPHDTCMRLAQLAAADACTETEALERAIYELARSLRLAL